MPLAYTLDGKHTMTLSNDTAYPGMVVLLNGQKYKHTFTEPNGVMVFKPVVVSEAYLTYMKTKESKV